MANMYDDRELIEKILNGKKSAFSLLIKKYEKMIWILISRMVLDEDEIKDICQEVFIKIYINLDQFKFNSKFSTWIATITYRLTLNHLRKKKKDNLADIQDEIFVETLISENDPSGYLEANELQSNVHNLLEKLPVQYRTIITLYHLDDFSYKEIGEITGMPDGTVKNYLFRARKILKDIIEKSWRLSLIF